MYLKLTRYDAAADAKQPFQMDCALDPILTMTETQEGTLITTYGGRNYIVAEKAQEVSAALDKYKSALADEKAAQDKLSNPVNP